MTALECSRGQAVGLGPENESGGGPLVCVLTSLVLVTRDEPSAAWDA